jgi:hypothetical protein
VEIAEKRKRVGKVVGPGIFRQGGARGSCNGSPGLTTPWHAGGVGARGR